MKPLARKSLGFDLLEDRCVPAAVAGLVSGGVLRITGTDAARAVVSPASEGLEAIRLQILRRDPRRLVRA